MNIPQDKGFYLNKADEYDLLEDVIQSEHYFTVALDVFFSHILEKSFETKKRLGGLLTTYEPDRTPLEDFASYVNMVVDLTYDEEVFTERWTDSMADYWETTAGEPARKFHNRWGNVGVYSATTVLIGGVLLFIPGGAILDIALLGGGALGFTKFAEKLLIRFGECRDAETECKEVLKPLYDLAEELDQRVGTLFAVDHYHNYTGTEVFEDTYMMLNEDNRTEVRVEMKNQLESGILEMSAPQLEQYFTDLEITIAEMEDDE